MRVTALPSWPRPTNWASEASSATNQTKTIPSATIPWTHRSSAPQATTKPSRKSIQFWWRACWRNWSKSWARAINHSQRRQNTFRKHATTICWRSTWMRRAEICNLSQRSAFLRWYRVWAAPAAAYTSTNHELIRRESIFWMSSVTRQTYNSCSKCKSSKPT